MEKFGLAYEDLVVKNTRLVYCSISGFGPEGPLSHCPGYDVIVSGMYGLMSITGDEEGRPAKVGVASTDVLTGTLAQSGILSALYARERNGVGQKVDVSLMESQLAGLVNIASSSLNSTTKSAAPPPKRWGTAHESIVPYQAFQCKSCNDDVGTESQYILVGAGNDSQFTKLCTILNIPQVATDPRFISNAARVDNRKYLVSLLQSVFLSKTHDEWFELLNGKGFPVGPLRNVQEAFQCAQAQHLGMVQEMDHPVVGKIRLPRSPIRFSSPSFIVEACDIMKDGDEARILPPPMLGEHTMEVLHETLKMDHQSIRRLEKDKVIECWGDT
jgi:crotonobetainyl-CoA:carnitine CoA-transferase CaiB-like acyl-CoA transferase